MDACSWVVHPTTLIEDSFAEAGHSERDDWPTMRNLTAEALDIRLGTV
ncbi:hypothetical protein GZL_06923 [Streptomyces sp. 769]|nr:hypothetical protein GZL_06923 [Streptomyces sp. 769]